MQKMICIPIEQYELMLKSYDDVVNELEEMKKALAEVSTSKRQETLSTQLGLDGNYNISLAPCKKRSVTDDKRYT